MEIHEALRSKETDTINVDEVEAGREKGAVAQGDLIYSFCFFFVSSLVFHFKC